MNNLLEIARFELGSKSRTPDFYLYPIAFFGLGFLLINMATGIPIAGIQMILPGLEYTNAPLTVAIVLTILGLMALLVGAGIFSEAACKDFETRFASILFSFPIRKQDYVGGRGLAAIVLTLPILLAPGSGYLLGEFMPYLNHDKLATFHPIGYGLAYFYLLLPNLLIFGSVFFSVGLLTRQTLLVYLIGASLFMGGGIVANTLGHFPEVASLLDPTGLAAIDVTTRLWTPAQKADALLPLSQEIFLNRLFWLTLSLGFLLWSLQQFRFSKLITSGKIAKGKRQNSEQHSALCIPNLTTRFPSITPSYHPQFRLVFSQTWIEFRSLISNRWFLIMLVVAIVPTLLVSSVKLMEAYGTSQYPLTHLLVDRASELFANLFKLLIIFLAGEIIWRDRTVRINAITDGLPIRTFVVLLSKFGALVLVAFSALLIILVSSVLVQTLNGYTRYEFGVYFTILFTRLLPQLVMLSALSLSLQVFVQNRYLGYFLAAVVLFTLPQLEALPQVPRILVYGAFPQASYSQFDGYGATLMPVRWFQAYWAAWATLLLTLAVLFWQRGVDIQWKARLKIAGQRFTRLMKVVLLGTIAAILSLGSWIFYNTRVLNPVFSVEAIEQSKADYEKHYRAEGMIQPQITHVSIDYALYPDQQRLSTQGQYILENKTKVPISTVQVFLRRINSVTIQESQLEQAQLIQTEQFPEFIVQTFQFIQPLAPGARITLNFKLQWQPQGFDERQPSTDLSTNGTSLSWHLPMVGYQQNATLTDAAIRRKYSLPAGFSDLSLVEQLQQINSVPQLVTSDITISTSADQIAVVPGTLQREWVKGNRRYFRYRMQDPTAFMPTLYSARYEVKRDHWQNVNLEIYYLKGHEYNVDRILNALKASLNYFTSQFGSYQYPQVRVFELPRGRFAVALPGTIGYSEFIGFLAKVDPHEQEAIDYPSYVAAHEVAHQWWGHQLVTYPDLKGTALLSEVLAQYSALMVMEKLYGRSIVGRILEQEQTMYRNGRSQAKTEEPLLTTSAAHVYYRKGVVAMYALRDAIGEEALNHALALFLHDYAKYSSSVPPYPTALELLRYLRAATPPEQQFLIRELFEEIILFDNRVQTARSQQLNNGKYRVEMTVIVQKLRLDEKGNETQAALHPGEKIDIGFFDKTGNLIYLDKHTLHSGENVVSVIVDEKPYKASIDPLNILINRVAEVNSIQIND